MCYLITSILFVLLISYGEGAKILGVFHVPGPSQYLAGKTMMKTLAGKGHDVTIVAPFAEKNLPKNYRHIFLDGLKRYNDEVPNLFEGTSSFIQPIFFTLSATRFVENTLNHSEFQKLMNSGEHFDLVIVEAFESEALTYVARHFNASLIMYNSMEANNWVNSYHANTEHPAYTPNKFLIHLSCHMTFFQRVHNTLFTVYTNLWRKFGLIRMQNELLHKYYPNAPDLNDIINDVDLVLLNSDFAVHEPLPKVPSFINIGGFHIEQPKKLPEDLQTLLDDSMNGVIYFSLGSNLRIQDMSRENLEIFLEAFSGIKETVLMKCDLKHLPGKPDNVVLREWLPQNDILAHKNVKLFISHGGLFSTMEAVYHGVPLLAIPVFADQNLNSKRAEMFGYARSLHFKELKKGIFKELLHELLQNPKYKENVIRSSNIMKDKPLEPSETLNYWVEYVVRHKGASHLRVAAIDLYWYEYLLLDVILFILMSSITVIYILKISFRNIVMRKLKNKAKKN